MSGFADANAGPVTGDSCIRWQIKEIWRSPAAMLEVHRQN
jgi:hypothetical protein